MARRLQIRVRGAPSVWIDGQPQSLRSRRAVALLAYLAVEDRPVPRPTLAALLWGPGRRMNLRQELSRLRRLPSSEHWLEAGPTVSVRAEVVNEPADGTFLEGFEDLGTDAFQEWLATHRSAVTSDLQTRLLRVLAIEPRVAPRAVAELLGVSEEALADAWTSLVQHGDWGAAGVRPGLAQAVRQALGSEATRLLHLAIGRAWSEHAGPPEAVADHFVLAGEPDRAAEHLLAHGQRTRHEPSLQRAVELASDPALRARIRAWICLDHRDHARDEALALAARELELDAARSQSAEALVEACLVATLRARDRNDRPALERQRERLTELGDVGEAQALIHLIDAMIALGSGSIADAHQAFERAHDRAVEVRVRVWAGNGQAAMLAAVGRLGDAERLQRRILQEARAAADRRAVVSTLANLALTVERRGDLQGAVARLDEVLELLREDLSARQTAVAMKNRALLALRRGEYGTVRKLALQLQDIGDPALGRLRLLRGELELELGRYPEAARWFRRSQEALSDEGEAVRRSARFGLCLALHCQGEAPADAVRQALDAIKQTGDRDLWRAHLTDVGLVCADPSLLALAADGLAELDADPLGRWAVSVRARRQPAGLPPGHTSLPQRREMLAASPMLLGAEPGLRPQLEALFSHASDGLLSTQADSLRRRMGL